MARKFDESSANVLIGRMGTDVNFTTGAQADLGDLPNVNVEDVSFSPGDVIVVPGEAEFNKFKFTQKIEGATNPAAGVVVNVVEGPDAGFSKRLYFSSLRKRVVVVNEAGIPKTKNDGSVEVVKPQDTDKGYTLYREVLQAPTMEAVGNLIKGKTFRIEHATGSPCRRATYDRGTRKVNGSAMTNVYQFIEVADAAAGA